MLCAVAFVVAFSTGIQLHGGGVQRSTRRYLRGFSALASSSYDMHTEFQCTATQMSKKYMCEYSEVGGLAENDRTMHVPMTGPACLA